MRQKVFKFALIIVATLLSAPVMVPAADLTLYYPPEWQTKAKQARVISEALSHDSGFPIKPVVAQSYPEILTAFSKNQPMLVYVGSFLQALLYSRGLSIPLVQAIDGKEFYTSILIAPSTAGTDPVGIVKAAGVSIAYAKGTSSGESGAKAASAGHANGATVNHAAAVAAITMGNSKCAFVKNWWWEANKGAFKGTIQLEYPDISDKKNPDNVLSATKAVSSQDIAKIKAAILKNAEAFQAKSFREFNPALLEPTLALMRKGNMDPKTYTW
jgi:ABC-type phosphate/phosphonate transport system substrate-binding protein